MRAGAKHLPALLFLAAVCGLVWLIGRFLLPMLAPFLAAFALAAALERPVRALARRGMPRKAASLLASLIAVTLLAALPLLLAGRVNSLLSAALHGAPRLIEAAVERLDELEHLARRCAAELPEGFSSLFEESLQNAEESLRSLPAALSTRLLALAAKIAQDAPGIVLFLFTMLLGSYLISASYPAVTAFLLAQLPEELRRRSAEIGEDLRTNLGGWLRAQLILAAMSFIELLGLFLLMGIRGALPLALLTALVDALPVFGTGTVLIPWALAALLLGRTGRAAGLLLGWALTAAGRNLLQAKLLGDQIGIPPLVSLLALYLGWKVWGVGGMIVFPLLLATLIRLSERGVIRLWNTP